MRLHWISDGREYSAELFDTPPTSVTLPVFHAYVNGTTYFRELQAGTVPKHSFVVQHNVEGAHLFIREIGIPRQTFLAQETFYLLVHEAFERQTGLTYTQYDGQSIMVDNNVPIDFQSQYSGDPGRRVEFRGVTGFAFIDAAGSDNYFLPIGGEYQHRRQSVVDGQYYYDPTWTSIDSVGDIEDIRLYRYLGSRRLFLQEDLYWENE